MQMSISLLTMGNNRVSFLIVISTSGEYKEVLITARNLLTKHSFLAKCQAIFLKSKKESLLPNEAVVLGDFAENYQFFIQVEIQSYYWSTVHPLVI